MFRKWIAPLALVASLLLPAVSSAWAFDIPRDNSRANYFYVYGPEGDPLNGKEDSALDLFVDVPADSTEPVVIKIYDPDSSLNLDDVSGYPPYENTKTTFTVSGNGVLDSKSSVGLDGNDSKWIQLGPFKPDQGRKVGDQYRFALQIRAESGDDQNLFKVKISPDSAAVFSDNVTFRLLPNSGDKMYFYPWVPEGLTRITIGNFDLDKEGGSSKLYDPASGKTYHVNDSTSGKWAETEVNLGTAPARRLVYTVTTRNQNRGNAGLRILDDKGNALPLYFRKGPGMQKPEPVPAPEPEGLPCNRFTFDARSSYDENNDKIDYLWDFGDGTTSAEDVVTHTYAQGGVYNVKLTVTDNSGLKCNTSVTSQEVRANTPPDAVFSGPGMTCTGSQVTFNASATKDDTPASLTYHWAFGDGTTAEGQTVTKSYAKGGVYDVVLTVDDNAGTSCSVDSLKQTIRVNTPPVAEAGKDKVLYLENSRADYRVVLDAGGSSDADRNDLAYSWDLGDGTSASGKRVEHVYAKPGDYKARLTVNDNSGTPCATDMDTVNITLNKPPVAMAGKAQYACFGAELTFDASQSAGEPGETLGFSWDFGDGSTASGPVVKHKYASGGKYTVRLTVDDGRGTPVSKNMDSTTVVVNTSPTVSIRDVGKVCAFDGVTFDATSSSDPDGDSLKYTWNFGDGTVESGGAKVSHKYKKGGSYQVTVTADDGRGSPCSTAHDSVLVKVNTPPVADAGPNLACCVEQQTGFDGSGSSDPEGDVLAYSWEFGDGTSGNTAKVSHAYAKSGSYRVVLTVDDQSGTACSSDSASFVAAVNAKPVPVIKVKAG